MSEYRFKLGVSEGGRSVWAKITRRRGHLSTTFLCIWKTRILDLLYGVRMSAEDYFVRVHAFDRQADRFQQQ